VLFRSKKETPRQKEDPAAPGRCCDDGKILRQGEDSATGEDLCSSETLEVYAVVK